MHRTLSAAGAFWLAAFTYFIWGFTFLASRIAQDYGTPFVLLFWRFALAFALLNLLRLTGRFPVRLRGRDGTVLSVTTKEGANAAMNVLDNALSRALDQQTTVGAMSSRLDYTISNLTVQSENLTDAKSTILDADMAKEMTEYTKNNVLLQAAQSMLAQANQSSSSVLSLLQ